MSLVTEAGAWTRRPAELPAVDRLRRVLMADPGAFEIRKPLNAHMTGPGGRLLAVDRAAAQRQWEALKAAFVAAGCEVAVLPAAAGQPDLCFTANPSLWLPLPGGGRECWLARMAHACRAGEVAHHARFARKQGVPVREMPPGVARFEGCGDGVLHPGRFLLHAGVGMRTERAAWEALAAARPELELLLYRLADPRFYHLDTALCALDENCALWVPQAFAPAGRRLLAAAFPDLIAVPPAEALRFAANAHTPDGCHVILQAGCPQTAAALRGRGFEVLEVETGEFRKSGGSVFCLKQAY